MDVSTSSLDQKPRERPFRESLLAMIGISFVIMLVGLDQTVVGTTLPTIVAELKGFDLYAWVATAYLLSSVVTVPIFGRLGDSYGRKPFLIASIVVFTAASALCGMAGNMLYLVLARALQGVGGGMLIGTVFACIPDLFPDPVVRLRWQAMASSAFGIANAVGPTLGGVMTEYLGWRSTFDVNVPIGLVSLIFVCKYLPHLRREERAGAGRIDWLGAVLLALLLGTLQLLVERLPQAGLGGSTLLLLVLAAMAGTVLWKWEQRHGNPLVPLDMFGNRTLGMLFALATLAGFAMFSLLFYAPLMFQGGFGMSPKDAGIAITPLVVASTIGSILNGRIMPRLRKPNAMLHLGFAMFACACLGVVLATRSTPPWLLMLAMAVGGLGLGFVLPNLTIFVQQMAGPARLGIATALVQSLRMVGAMLGTAMTGTLVNQLYVSAIRRKLEADHAMAWHERLSDPRALIDPLVQNTIVGEMTKSGHNGALLIEFSRSALVAAIHIGLIPTVLAAAYALWRSRSLPSFELERRR
ncbi:MDR family MFS transporter [Paraburkholderia unamae]|uniref:EmrB/QacA subfamily drug resistance transporter n=1 Tax=Paraburkholderia unamae TaxID=219649 RepID=A0ABX5K9Q8_9BURK|nr:MDR family MFS transporter [Paraburkholderia unamae]PVX71599.1 EmrB/QacA subfamily drug resistance transporter [Paraburkholderia unamae]CAG9274699.1 Permeases of the major facilitator superfamily [Paraburkholderia unamae]